MNFEVGSSSNAAFKQEIDQDDIELTSLVTIGSVTTDIQDTAQILLDCVEKTKGRDEFSPIYMAPSRLRELSPGSFTPRVVSIGPLHRYNTNLKGMEAVKGTFLDELLDEVGYRKEILEKCVKTVSDNIQIIRGCYLGMRTAYNDTELTQMMVMDGCFILQFISKLSTTGNLLLENRLRSRSVALDLVLLENQIPFFVLRDIYELTFYKLQSRPPLTTMLTSLLELINPFLEDLNIDTLGTQPTYHYHILDLLYKFYQPNTPLPMISVIPTAHSVVNLDKVGVKFRPKEKKNWPMAMEFESSGKPTLIMPAVYIDNFFEVVIRNLIVWEQYSPVNNHVTSYAMAMDMLADSPEDIAKLGQSNIIINHLGSNEKASNMINNICKDVTFVDFYYIEPWKNMDSYYDSYWSRHFGILRRTHFDSPWKTIALIAGIILFTLNLVQFTFFLMDK